jgi:hypothetical protein
MGEGILDDGVICHIREDRLTMVNDDCRIQPKT